jgi:hypothetical protein
MKPLPLILATLATGCATAPLLTAPTAAPRNVHAATARLPATLQRVVVLPLTGTGADSLQPVWIAEWHKTAHFEVIAPTAAELRALTGLSGAHAAAPLPADFLDRLRQATGCDAVLFGHLTAFHPYPPLRVGWNVKLVTVTDTQTVWAADEVFDAGQPGVADAARRYASAHRRVAPPLHDPDSILLSPRGFGQYTVAALAATVPPR